MDANTITAVMAFAGVIISAFIGFLGNKKNTLAGAEKDFRELILKDNEDLRARVKELEISVRTLSEENAQMKLQLGAAPE